MDNTRELIKTSVPSSEAAVDGLLAGVAAGMYMMILLIGGGILLGTHPSAVLGRFDPSGNMAPGVGLLAHLSISAVYGALFGLLWKITGSLRRLGLPEWGYGMLYGLVLYIIAQYLVMPRIETNLAQFPPLHLLAAHLLYGLALGGGLIKLLSQKPD